jgi:hypothetical protein
MAILQSKKGEAMKVVLNDEAVTNDYGFRILNSGIDWTRYRLNPVVLLNHNVNDMAIGTIDPLSIKTEGTLIVAELTWDKADDRALIQTLIGKYENGVQKAFSSGLNVFQFEKIEGVPVATKSEYYELSAVTIPSNRNTVRLMNKAGSVIPLSTKGKTVTLSYDGTNLDFSKIELGSNMDELKKIALALGLGETATADDCVAAINGMKTQQSADATEMSQLRTARVDTKLVELTSKGIVTDGNRELVKAQLTTNYKDASAMLDAMPTVTKVEPPKNTEGGANATTLLALLQANAAATQKPDPNNKDNWTFDEWSKRDAVGLAQLKAANPTKFAALMTAHRAANPV